jgi:tRNA pseudouridine55 synthase
VNVTQEDIDAVTHRFTGRIRQLPPMHSALKKDSKALYEYARAGIEVEPEHHHSPRDDVGQFYKK